MIAQRLDDLEPPAHMGGGHVRAERKALVAA